VGHSLEGQIGSGGPRIKLDNVNGGIKITHAEDGRTISPATSVVIDRQKIREESERARKTANEESNKRRQSPSQRAPALRLLVLHDKPSVKRNSRSIAH
jgi:hypothetical protein